MNERHNTIYNSRDRDNSDLAVDNQEVQSKRIISLEAFIALQSLNRMNEK